MAELQQLFLIEAAKYNASHWTTGVPSDLTRNRRTASIDGPPHSLTLYPGMIHLMENAVLNVKNSPTASRRS